MSKDYDRQYWERWSSRTRSEIARTESAFYYRHRYASWYCRHPRTTNELRQLRCDDADGLPVRRKRLTIRTAYDDPPVSRNYGKSWKDYTKRRKQWDR
jgi:hypothetical protein